MCYPQSRPVEALEKKPPSIVQLRKAQTPPVKLTICGDKMKLLSVVVPCYNSQSYMRHCIESLLHGGEDVEIIIVNDGSADATGLIAGEYAQRYPGLVRAIHQENKGHGGAINTGLAAAEGFYFKVVDSDDWLDKDAYMRLLEVLRGFSPGGEPDMVLSNYVYEKDGKKNKAVVEYTGILPQDRVFSWDEVGSFPTGRYILMHSVIYRRQLLSDCGLRLPEHTFYVDNLFVYSPLPYVESMYYVDADLYRYFIGREDQSINEQVMIRRIDQQLKVNRLMLDSVSLNTIENERQRSYMFKYLEIITAVSSVMLLRSGTDENIEKKKALWEYIKQINKPLYYRLRYRFMGFVVCLPGSGGRQLALLVYKASQKVVGFN